jgi:FemAB-related protein (PEP-CTERM system-associated)
MIFIRDCPKSDKQKWDSYVLNHPEGTLFHLTKWKEVVEKTFNHNSHYLLAKNFKGQVTGLLPLLHIKSLLFGNYLVSIPFAELGGILADDDSVAQKLLEKAESLAVELNCDYLELRNRHPIRGLPTKSLYYNFKKEIFPDPDRNMNAIPRKARRMIRQAIKFGLKSETGNHLINDFYDVLSKNFHTLGTPVFPKRWFRNFLDIFNQSATILIVRYNEQPIAGVLSFYYKDTVMPYYAGSLVEKRNLAPNDFMYWELMRRSCEEGYKYFDYGRSKAETGSFHFKRHWGFEPQTLAYQYRLLRAEELPNLSPSNPNYRRKIEIWKKMPLEVTKVIGPAIAKYLS